MKDDCEIENDAISSSYGEYSEEAQEIWDEEDPEDDE